MEPVDKSFCPDSDWEGVEKGRLEEFTNMDRFGVFKRRLSAKTSEYKVVDGTWVAVDGSTTR